jgi:hypothetical protein
MTQHHPRIRSSFNPQAIAEWMFDNGHGYVDEPHFELFDTFFYASDFLPEHREALLRKTREAEALQDIRKQRKEFSDAYLFPEHTPEDPLFDQEQMQALLLDCHNNAEAGLNDDEAFNAAHALLQRIASGETTLFSRQTLEESRCKQPPHRRSFVRIMQNLPEEILEYAARKELSVYLNTDFQHDLYGRAEKTYGLNMLLSLPENAHNKPLQLSRQVYAAGLNQQDPKQTSLIIAHEMAHCIASAPLNESNLNPAQLALFQSKLAPLQTTLDRLKSEGDEAQWHLPIAQDGPETLAPVEKLIHALHLNPANYPTKDQRAAEVFCNMLALSYSYLQGDEGAAKLRKHYAHHYPDEPELPEVILELRDVVQGIFKQKLRELRETNPLPDGIGWQAGLRGA